MADHDTIDPDALNEHARFVRSVARAALSGDDALAEDVAQDTFVAALESARQPRSLRAWLGGITRRKAAQSVQREAAVHRRERRAARSEHAPDPAAIAERVNAGRRLAAAVLTLEERYRVPILLRFYEGLPPREIAAQLGVPVETVRTRLRRGLERLRGTLEPDMRRVLVPLLATPGALVAATTIGGTAMAGKKIAAVGTAVVLLAGGTAWWSLRADDTQDDAVPRPIVHAERPHDGARVPDGAPADAPEPEPEPEPARAPAPVRAPESGAASNETTPVPPAPVLQTPTPPAPPPVPVERVPEATETFDPDRHIHGLVVRGDGSPVAGATITTDAYPWNIQRTYFREPWYLEAKPGPMTTTGADGTFHLPFDPAKTVRLHVRAEGLAAVSLREVAAGQRLRIVLSEGVDLVVVAKGPDRRPAAHVALKVFAYTKEPPRVRITTDAVTTDANGRAVFERLPGNVQARVGLAGFHARWRGSAHRSIPLPASGTVEADVPLTPGSAIRGRVTDAVTRAPIRGARVGAGIYLHKPGVDHVLTDENGQYEIPAGFRTGYIHLNAIAPGYATALMPMPTGAGADFALTPAATALGRVVDAEGKPVAGARLSAMVWKDMGMVTTVVSLDSAETDAEGRFALRGLAPDTNHELRVVAPGHATLVSGVSAPASGASTRLGDLTLGGAGRVVVTVRDAAGEAVTRIQATLYRAAPGGARNSWTVVAEAQASDAGRVRFAGVAPGTYLMRLGTRIQSGVAGWVNIQREIVVPPEGGRVTVDLDTGTRTLHVRTVDEHGTALPGIHLHVYDGPPEAYMPSRDPQTGRMRPLRFVISGRSDDEGHLALQVAADAKEIRLSVGSRGYDRTPVPVPGDAETFDLVLHTSAALTGQLVGRDEKPIGLARIHVTGDEREPVVLETDREGRFRHRFGKGPRVTLQFLGEVRDRTSWAFVRVPMKARRINVRPEAQDVTLRARPVSTRRTLKVTVLAPDGQPMQDVAVGVAGLATTVKTDADGSVRLGSLPALPLTVTVAHEPTTTQPWLVPATDIEEPKGQRIEIRLTEGAPIEGRLLLPNGAPAKGGEILLRGTPPAPPARLPVDREGRFFLVVPKTQNGVLLKGVATDAKGQKLTSRRWHGFRLDDAPVTVQLE